MAEVAASVEIVPSKGDADGSRLKEYEAMYQYSITRPEEFWAKVRRPFSPSPESFFRGRVSPHPLLFRSLSPPSHGGASHGSLRTNAAAR